MPISSQCIFPYRLILLLAGALLLQVGCSTVPVPPALDQSRLIRQGSVQLEPSLKCVVATGFVNMVDGPIELMACGPGGKTHESVLVLNANPVDLQAALLLIGLKPGPPMKELGAGPPRGDPVAIWVRWQQDGSAVVRSLCELAWERQGNRTLRRAGWIFTGSTFENGKFKALAEESLIANYWDPWAIINVDSPLGADDETMDANSHTLPPVNTPVTVIIERL